MRFKYFMGDARIFPEHRIRITSNLHLNPNNQSRGLTTMETPKGNNKLVLLALSLTANAASVATAKPAVKATPDAAKCSLFAGNKS